MKWTRVYAIALAAVLGSGCAAANTSAPTAPIERSAADFLRTSLERAAPFGFSGAVLLAQNGEVLLREGYGIANRERGLPITPTTVFYIGSLTKQFTAAAILKLHQQGRLAVEDSIAKFFANVPPDKRGITLHHLLTHTAGLDADGSDEEMIGRDSLVRRVLASELLAPPGEEWAYSNAGYNLLAAVVEIASGQPYERFLHAELFRPAGIARTGYTLPPWPQDSIAHGYRAGEDWGSPLDQPRAEDGPSWNLRGAGGMLSTVDDLTRWVSALSKDRVLSRASREMLVHPHVQMIPGSDLYYGYGWILEGVSDQRTAWHNGSNTIFWSALRWDPAGDRFLITLTNQQDAGNFANEDVLLLFSEQIFAISAGATAPEALSCVYSVSPAALAAYEGTYRLDGGGHFIVTGADGGLRIAPIGQEAVSALVTLDAAVATYYEDLSARANAIFADLLRGEWDSLREAAAESAFERTKRVIERVRDAAEERSGPVHGHEVLGTIGEWWSFMGSEQRSPVTFVQLNSEHGSRVLRLHWRSGRITGVGGQQIPSPARILFLPQSPEGFAAFHPRLSVRGHLQFRSDRGKVPVELVIVDASGGEQVARRHH